MRRPFLALLACAASPLAAEAGVFAPTEPREAASADVEIVNAVGHDHILADFLPGAPAILYFWATTCTPCREELPGLADYADQLTEEGRRDRLVIVALDPSPREEIDSYLVDLGLGGFVTLQDRGNKSDVVFGLSDMPTTVLVDAEGRVVGQHTGPVDWADYAARRELAAHLEN